MSRIAANQSPYTLAQLQQIRRVLNEERLAATFYKAIVACDAKLIAELFKLVKYKDRFLYVARAVQNREFLRWDKTPGQLKDFFRQWAETSTDNDFALRVIVRDFPAKLAQQWFTFKPSRLRDYLSAIELEVGYTVRSDYHPGELPRKLLHGATTELIAKNYASYRETFEQIIDHIVEAHRLRNLSSEEKVEEFKELQTQVEKDARYCAEIALQNKAATQETIRA